MTAAALPDTSWDMNIAARADRLIDIRKFVEEVAAEMSLDPERAFDLKVAVSEACANSVEHAGCEAADLQVAARCANRRLTFTITDRGRFRPPACSSEEFGNRGLGLPLMVALMDQVSISRLRDGGTEVSLSILLD